MLTALQSEILRLAALYRVLTIGAVDRLLYDGKNKEASKKALQVLVAKGLLRSLRGLQRRSLYFLTGQGAQAIDAPRHVALPLGTQALIARYAVMSFLVFHSGETARALYSREE